MATQILIPLKHLDNAKRRLHPQIGVEGRRSMMLAMLAHVAAEALAADVGPVALASSEPRAPMIAAEHGIGLVDDGGLPWNEGLAHALGLLPAPPEAVLFLAGDLPLVTADEIRQLAAAVPAHGVAIGRAHDGGTNALGLRPPDAMVPSFGSPQSARVHAQLAGRERLEVVVVDLPGIALDVDTPADAERARLSA
ncbi:MAG TPA: 2-phospho-L-lactate guanylyltransferase [Gaiellales bacterium]|nr:2-phospho-L-lactate guanylyltransferase [Gaiellales bacterium]